MTLRRTALARKTELARRSNPLRRKTAMARVAQAKRTVGKQQKQRDTGPDQATKELLWQRARGRCERCGRDLNNGFPISRHHRRPRGMGGSSEPWVNDVSNLLLLCGSATTPDGCHLYVEQHRQEAYDAGWLIPYSSKYLPTELPVMIYAVLAGPGLSVFRDLVYLTSDGAYAKGVD